MFTTHTIKYQPPMSKSILIVLVALVALITNAQGVALSDEAPTSWNNRVADPKSNQVIPSTKNNITIAASRQGGLCESNDDCDGGQTCTGIFSGSCSDPNAICICYSGSFFDSCSADEPCSGGDACAKNEAINLSYCVPCDKLKEQEGVTVVGENPCEEKSGVCIDAKLLSHLPSDELVFNHNRRAAVLCDANGSCATPGHMLTYKNKPMMMSTYCKLIDTPCSKRVMSVNSPRMKRALRIPSRTHELVFTPLSAQYGSVVEESVLSALVHMGI